MQDYDTLFLIRDLFGFAGGLIALPAFILHISTKPGTKFKDMIGLYMLDAFAVAFILLSIFYY